MDESMHKGLGEEEEFVIIRCLDGEEPHVISLGHKHLSPDEDERSRKHTEEFDLKHSHRCPDMTIAEAEAQIRLKADKYHMIDFSAHMVLLGDQLSFAGAPYKALPDHSAVGVHVAGVKFCPFCGEAINAIEYTGSVDSPDKEQ